MFRKVRSRYATRRSLKVETERERYSDEEKVFRQPRCMIRFAIELEGGDRDEETALKRRKSCSICHVQDMLP